MVQINQDTPCWRDKLAEYEIKAEINGQSITVDLDLEANNVKLHFLRYGLLRKEYYSEYLLRFR